MADASSGEAWVIADWLDDHQFELAEELLARGQITQTLSDGSTITITRTAKDV